MKFRPQGLGFCVQGTYHHGALIVSPCQEQGHEGEDCPEACEGATTHAPLNP